MEGSEFLRASVGEGRVSASGEGLSSEERLSDMAAVMIAFPRDTTMDCALDGRWRQSEVRYQRDGELDSRSSRDALRALVSRTGFQHLKFRHAPSATLAFPHAA